MAKKQKLPKIGMLYLDHVLRFFDKSNFRGWPDKIETVVYHWKNDKDRFIREVKRKKIDILIGNIPATAYETFREIARELPQVQFIPSMDTQFSNKSKENVTRFAWKYDIPIPKTYIYYDKDKADNFIEETQYPKIIKKSYGPSNYGGYFVHKVDSKEEASDLLNQKKYHPAYFQDFVPMEADVRVMLIGHKPVCAFWRRPPEGEWLTNTSQGGSMDYMDVPKELLDLAVQVSKSANAEYWACDVAVGEDGKYRILECATAFAAFPYIRDWIGQYLMHKFSNGRFPLPNIPLYNWEELGKMDASVLRTLRYITFGRYTPSYDGAYFLDKKKRETEGGEIHLHELDALYPMLVTQDKSEEEWPSEKWNFQDNYGKNIKKVHAKSNPPTSISEGDESEESQIQEPSIVLTEKKVEKLLTSVKGIGKKKCDHIMDKFDTTEIVHTLETAPEKFMKDISWFNQKLLTKLVKEWETFKAKL
ncbi:MAG: Ribosomal protein S6 glutaminyl transferase [uncultured Sulfurovum sp.]|uniref:Ribosomal protein S6 glutaminyl transferase n=1 Tax=uncultured Sulfurovum sp. TaxID=269237 RepID=A0A6S6U1G1_9BACT|nr:MAG: Ribosomal protein S6 glutaminyl transferase [uncultured Sulfurovum sp.]